MPLAQNKLRLLHLGLHSLAALPALLTLLTCFSVLWWPFALLEHFRFQYSLLLVLVLLIAGLYPSPWRVKRGYLVWLIPLLFNISLVGWAISGPPQSSALPPHELRLLHITLDHDNPEVAPAIQTILRQQPDVVSLLEVTPQSLPQFQAALPGYQLVIGHPRTNSHGSAWFIASQQPIKPLEAELIHLPPDSDRPLLRTRLQIAGTAIDLLCFHVIRPRNHNTVAYQQIEFNALAQWSRTLQQQGQQRVIAIGDFNSTPWYGPFRHLLASSGLVNSQRGWGLQPTWNSEFPDLLRIPIDHCLHSRALVTTQRHIGPAIGSDHLPLLVTLSF